MPDLIDLPSSPRRPRVLLILIACAAAVLFGGGRVLAWYVDALWFGSLGYTSVFRRTLLLNWGIFGVFFVLTFAVLFGGFLLLRGGRPGTGIVRSVLVNGQPLTVDLGRWLKPAVLLGSLFVAWISGSSLSAEWPTFARWMYAAHTGGAADPVLGRSLDFYLLTLPMLQLLAGWLLVMAVLVVAMAVALLVLQQRPSLQQFDYLDVGERPRWRGVAGAVALLLLVLALEAWLSRFGLLLADHTVFSGATYTDAHVHLPGLALVGAVLLLGAVRCVSRGAACWRACHRAGRAGRAAGRAALPRGAGGGRGG